MYPEGYQGFESLPLRQLIAGSVLFFELFPAFVTIVATTIAVALFIMARRRRNDPERTLEQRDPSQVDAQRGARFTRPSMRG